MFETIRRRGLLGGTAAIVAGLAGCGESGDGTGDTSERLATDDETVDDTTTNDRPRQATVPPHDHGGSDAGGDDLAPASLRAASVTAGEATIDRLTADRLDARTTNGVVNVASYPGSDLGERWNAAVAAEEQVGHRVWRVPPGEYRLTTPVDLTGGRFDGLTRGVGVDCRGARITLATDGQPAFDVSDTGYLTFDAGLMIGDSDAPPSVGVLVGDSEPRGGPEGRRLTGATLGAFGVAPVYVHGREHVVIDDARLRNANDAGYVVAASPGNTLEVETPFGSLSSASSVQNLTIRGSKLFSTTAPGEAVCLFEGRTPHLTMRDTEIASAGEPHVDCDLRREGTTFATFESLRMRPWFPAEPDSAPAFRVRDGGRGATLGDVAIRDVYFSGRNADGDVTAPFFETTGNVSVTDLTLDGRARLVCANPGIDIAGDLRQSDLRVGNKQLRVGGDLRDTRVRGKFSPDGFGLDVAGETTNVLYWSRDDGRFRALGGQLG